MFSFAMLSLPWYGQKRLGGIGTPQDFFYQEMLAL